MFLLIFGIIFIWSIAKGQPFLAHFYFVFLLEAPGVTELPCVICAGAAGRASGARAVECSVNQVLFREVKNDLEKGGLNFDIKLLKYLAPSF
jgi:hypothetical protein